MSQEEKPFKHPSFYPGDAPETEHPFSLYISVWILLFVSKSGNKEPIRAQAKFGAQTIVDKPQKCKIEKAAKPPTR